MTAAALPKTCSTCRFWSQWLSNTGDCMAYATKRRDALPGWDAEDGDFGTVWPIKSAAMTGGGQTCAEWEAGS